MAQDSDRMHIAVRIVLVQFLVAVFVAGIVYMIKGWVAGYSVLLGALAGILPVAAFATVAFKSNSADAQIILSTFFSGVILKYVLAAVLFSVVILYVKPLLPLMALTGLIATQLALVFIPMLKN